MKKEDLQLITTAKEVTAAAIKNAIIGNTTEDIGQVAEETAKIYGFDTIKELGGHGVGKKIHDKPFIPNAKNLGVPVVKIKEGMVLAIEPIVTAGSWKIKTADDGYLLLTSDSKKTAQFEDTILVTKDGPEILTKLN